MKMLKLAEGAAVAEAAAGANDLHLPPAVPLPLERKRRHREAMPQTVLAMTLRRLTPTLIVRVQKGGILKATMAYILRIPFL